MSDDKKDEEERKGTLLFVDDEVSILKSLKRLFLPLGYEVFIAEGGKKGLEVLKEEEIDLIVSDMRMPEMDGAAFLKEAAAHWPDVKRVLLTGYAEMESAISAVNEGKINYYLSKPWKDEEVIIVIENLLETKLLKEKNVQLESKVVEQNEKLKELNASLEEKVKKRTKELKKAFDELEKSYESSVQVLCNLVEMHEGQKKGVCRAVADQAKRVAKKLELSSDEIQDIYFASLLHSIGKIGFAKDILETPFMEMDSYQLKKLTQYPLLGEAALMSFEPLKAVATIILHHKEQYDGTGFPNKVKGPDIPIGSRILGMVVDYMELQEGVLLKDKLPAKQALDFIKSNRKKRYDPKLIEVFEDVLSESPDDQELLDEKIVSYAELEPDMVLTRDLVMPSGIMLLQKGSVLTDQYIEKVKKIDDLVIYIKASKKKKATKEKAETKKKTASNDKKKKE